MLLIYTLHRFHVSFRRNLKVKLESTQEIEAAEEKLRVELERLQYVVAERDGAAFSAASIEKKELQADGQRSGLSSMQDFSTVEEQRLQSIKVELVS